MLTIKMGGCSLETLTSKTPGGMYVTMYVCRGVYVVWRCVECVGGVRGRGVWGVGGSCGGR